MLSIPCSVCYSQISHMHCCRWHIHPSAVCSQKCEKDLYFREATVSSRFGVTYHNVKALADHLGESVCNILSAFHALTGSDFTQPFFGRSKFTSYKKMQKIQSISQPDTLGSLHANQTTITDFILHTIYNRPRNEKTPGESRYVLLFRKGERRTAKKIITSKRIPPDSSSLKCLIQRADFVTNGWLNCLDGHYTPPDPLLYGW